MKPSLLAAGILVAAACSLGARAGAAEAPPAPAPALGACIWAGLPQSVRDDYIKAYAAGGPAVAGTAVLQPINVQVKAATTACAGRADIPQLWMAAVVSGSATEAGALAKLGPSGIDRAKLLQAWDAAPAAARDCTLANAAKPFNITGPACPNPTAAIAFLPLVGITDVKARAGDAADVLTFFNAMAQDGWAETLIARMPAQAP